MKNKKNRRSKAVSYIKGLSVTPERRRQLGGVVSEPISEKDGIKAYTRRDRAKVECALDHYKDLKKIALSEFEAGMKFRRAYMLVVYHVHVYDKRAPGHGDTEIGFLMPIFSERLLREAYAALSPAQKSLIIDVCGEDKGVGDTNRLKTLKRGLAILVRLWKLC